MKKSLILLWAFSALFFVTANAQATLMLAEWDMHVAVAQASNSYGLSAGDSLSGFAYYDDAILTGVGAEFLSFGAGSGNHMQFNIPTLTFHETNDNSYSSGLQPVIKFEDGSPVGISYYADVVLGVPFAGANYRLEVYDTLFWRVTDYFGRTSTGDYGNFTQTPVPEPATLLLLCSGFVGLIAGRKIFRKMQR